jgi:hypothetical protein
MLGKKKFENFRSSITVIWKPRSSIGALSILTKLDISILHHRPSLQYCPVLSGLHHLNSTIDFFFPKNRMLKRAQTSESCYRKGDETFEKVVPILSYACKYSFGLILKLGQKGVGGECSGDG